MKPMNNLDRISRYKIEPRVHRSQRDQIVFRYLLKSDILNEDKDFHKFMNENNIEPFILEDEEVYLWTDFCNWHNRRY